MKGTKKEREKMNGRRSRIEREKYSKPGEKNAAAIERQEVSNVMQYSRPSSRQDSTDKSCLL
jgi:hypothetical protein